MRIQIQSRIPILSWKCAGSALNVFSLLSASFTHVMSSFSLTCLTALILSQSARVSLLFFCSRNLPVRWVCWVRCSLCASLLLSLTCQAKAKFIINHECWTRCSSMFAFATCLFVRHGLHVCNCFMSKCSCNVHKCVCCSHTRSSISQECTNDLKPFPAVTI